MVNDPGTGVGVGVKVGVGVFVGVRVGHIHLIGAVSRTRDQDSVYACSGRRRSLGAGWIAPGFLEVIARPRDLRLGILLGVLRTALRQGADLATLAVRHSHPLAGRDVENDRAEVLAWLVKAAALDPAGVGGEGCAVAVVGVVDDDLAVLDGDGGD